jgi:hypothetical protein
MAWYREKHSATFQHDDPATPRTHDGIDIPWANLGGVTGRSVTDQIGYLRKCNAIHGWIVRELAEGVDECQEIGMAPEDVDALLAAIEEALANPGARGPLEPVSGFFFGSDAKDEYWVEDLRCARAIMLWIKEDIARSEAGPQDGRWVTTRYFYRASW